MFVSLLNEMPNEKVSFHQISLLMSCEELPTFFGVVFFSYREESAILFLFTRFGFLSSNFIGTASDAH